MGIHLAYVANNNTNRLFTSYSGNGKDWQSRTRVGNQSSKRAPKLSYIRFGPEPFVLAYVSNNKFNQLLVTNSSDGQHWSTDQPVTNQSSKTAPALAVFQNKLWLAYVSNNKFNQLLVTNSSDGQHWSTDQPVTNQSSKTAPALLARAP
jgi:hypothetical protein